jgi:hypothetical protein
MSSEHEEIVALSPSGRIAARLDKGRETKTPSFAFSLRRVIRLCQE